MVELSCYPVRVSVRQIHRRRLRAYIYTKKMIDLTLMMVQVVTVPPTDRDRSKVKLYQTISLSLILSEIFLWRVLFFDLK